MAKRTISATARSCSRGFRRGSTALTGSSTPPLRHHRYAQPQSSSLWYRALQPRQEPLGATCAGVVSRSCGSIPRASRWRRCGRGSRWTGAWRRRA